MILSSADILRILGGSEVIRLSAKLKIIDGKPVLSGAEGLFIYIDRFPSTDEFQATWTIYIESDGSEPDDLVLAEIKKLLPSVNIKPGLMTTVTTTDFLSANTQRAPETPKQVKPQVDLSQYEERFQSLVEDVQDQMLLVTSGRAGKDGKDGRDGADGRDGKDLIATDAELFDLQDVEQGIQMERGQVLTWDGSKWTNLYVRQTMSAGGPAGGEGGSGVNTLSALLDTDTSGVEDGEILVYRSATGDWTAEPASNTGIPEAPQDGNYYVRQNGTWVNLADALTALDNRTIDGGDFINGTSAGDTEVVDGGNFS